jgi:hypothetical protein
MSKEAGTHEYSGACAPGDYGGVWDTFSVGVFEWVPRKSGRGTKRSKAKVRVKGPSEHPERVYAKAREIAAQLDTGTYAGPKTVVIRG